MEELNASATNWLSDLEMDDYDLFPQCHLNLLDDEDHQFLSHDLVRALEGENLELQHPLPSERNSPHHASADETSFERQQLKTNSSSWNSSTITEHLSPVLSPSSSPSSSPTYQILSFENSNSSPANTTTTTTTQFYGFGGTLNPRQNEAVPVSLPQQGNMSFSDQPRKGSSENKNLETRKPQGQGTKRPPAHAQDHILAERKRREKLSQSLIALAALIPGLKKMDKASVLGDAIKYVKELQERLRVLEEQNNKREVESVVIVNKPQVSSDDDSSSCDDESFEAGSGGGEALPHVEARVAEKEVLLRIHCHKQKGLYVKLLSEIQGLHLFVVNSSVLPFGDSALDITIVAQMGSDYRLTIKDLVRNLRVATLKSMS